MGRFTRRRLLALLGVAGLAGLIALRLGLPRLMRPGRRRALSPETAEFVRSCQNGLDLSRVWDSHVHVVGLGSGDTGCRIHPDLQSWLHPIRNLQYDVYRAAVGMTDERSADADYIERLLELQRQANPDGRVLALAFDDYVTESGEARPDLSAFHTPDAYVLRLAAQHRELEACASIHPYRVDATDRLDAAFEAGARAIKWLPNMMGIDPAAPRCERFYRRLAELGLPLISHGGQEFAVAGNLEQELGNPLRLRRALDAGVKVVMAHCASVGTMDAAELGDAEHERMHAFDLFMRMFTDPRYEHTLFGDISAVTQVNRSPRILRELLAAEELHPRLVNGSDYPLPSLRVIYSTFKMQLDGLLDAERKKHCDQIARVNPLLFDFVLKRSLEVETESGSHRFSPCVFESAWLFERS